jgi:3D (Asp-Asp-Asp) domain-containing protein
MGIFIWNHVLVLFLSGASILEAQSFREDEMGLNSDEETELENADSKGMSELNLTQSQALQFKLPSPQKLSSAIQLWSTRYYTPKYQHSSNKSFGLYDLSGHFLGVKLTQKEWCFAGLEGSLQVSFPGGSRKTFNFAGFGTRSQVDCSPYFKYTKTGFIRYKVAKGPYGDGYHGSDYILFPYRSLAVDPNFIPIGTVIYIPKAKGVTVNLSSGKTFVHDGYFVATDIGGAIKGSHVDMFQGLEYTEAFAHIVKSNAKYTFKAHRVKDANIIQVLQDASHYRTSVLKGTEF